MTMMRVSFSCERGAEGWIETVDVGSFSCERGAEGWIKTVDVGSGGKLR